MSKKIIDKILWIEGFYPFSMRYDQQKAVERHIQELSSLEIDPTSESIFKYSSYFNSYFRDICSTLDAVLKKSILDKSTFIDLLIAELNRTEIIVTEDNKKELLSGKSFDNNMSSNSYIHKPEFQNNIESVWGLIDSAIETATLNLNYLKYVKFNKHGKTINELSQLEVIRNMVFVGSMFNAIKQSYDRIIWRGDIIKYEESAIKLKANQRNLMLDNAALTRLIRNIESVQLELQHDTEKYKSIRRKYHKSRQYKVIKSIEEYNGELVCKYQGKQKKITDSYILFTAPILTYYPFFHTEKISQFDNLTILDLVNLFSLLYDFVSALPLPNYDDTEVKDLAKLKRFNPKVDKSTLINYFKETTKYTEKQILIFLSLLTQKKDKHNLFLYPIYEENGCFYFSHSTVKRANMLYLVDKWLDAGNCDLAERGYKFENYIKDFLQREKMNPFAGFEIIEDSNFWFLDNTNTRQEEEIDLILKTDTTLIIAEIKCIKYPMEPNDFYSSFRIIEKARNQIVRKAKFLEENWCKFEDLLGKKGEREINKIIVVNFPHYAGRIVKGIPVADFYLFLSYFKSGNFTTLKIEHKKVMTVNETPYYNSVSSFEKNFKSFFLDPIPIQDLVSRQRIEEYEVTLKGTRPKVMAERVIYMKKN